MKRRQKQGNITKNTKQSIDKLNEKQKEYSAANKDTKIKEYKAEHRDK
jgi:hypothetical protein